MTDKIRIAYLIDTISSDKAGTEKQLLNIIRRLDNYPTVICLKHSPWLSRNTLPCDLVTLGYRGFLAPGFPLVLAQYLRCLKERNIDLVQTFFEDSMFVGCMGKLLSRKRHALIISRRDLGLGSDEPAYHWLYKKMRPLFFRAGDGIAVNANAIKAQLFENEKVPLEKMVVIPNGIDLPAPPHVLPKLFDEYHADVWIGIVANLKPVKRIDLLLRAMAHIRERGIREVVRVVILGEGRLRRDLVELAAELRIADRVHFVGAVENVSDYLHGVDVGVLCSDREGLSNAILEYMACGLPVVATSVGGNCELVDQTNGICIAAGDHIALGEALLRLSSSAELRKSLGKRSLEKVRDDFAWGTIIQQWESYYRSFEDLEAVAC